MSNTKYVLITAARDEEEFIEATLKSVVAQSLLPVKWVIISDGSTDRTEAMVSEYAREHDFIKLIRLEAKEQRNFAAKVQALKMGYEAVQDEEYDLIGNLDADASFESDYYERIIAEFDRNGKLGVAGGITYDKIDDKFVQVRAIENRVCGMIQMFRRECFEEIGGYLELRYGGEDTAASIMAMMNGWEVRTFLDIDAYHHRNRGISKNGYWQARTRQGMMFYQLGWSPLYMLLQTISRFSEKPWVWGSLVRFGSFFRAWLAREELMVSDEFVSYVLKEQRRSIKHVFYGDKLEAGS